MLGTDEGSEVLLQAGDEIDGLTVAEKNSIKFGRQGMNGAGKIAVRVLLTGRRANQSINTRGGEVVAVIDASPRR